VTAKKSAARQKKASAPGCEETLHELFEADIDNRGVWAPLKTSFLA